VGPLFERWLLKTTINLLVARELVIADGALSLEAVPERLVRVAFGLESLPEPTGVYLAFMPNEELSGSGSLTVGLLAGLTEGVLGVMYTVHGFRFLLWLATPGPPSLLELPGSGETGWDASQLRRHAPFLGFKVNRRDSHCLDFVWPVG
jgi:hypothetical protein